MATEEHSFTPFKETKKNLYSAFGSSKRSSASSAFTQFTLDSDEETELSLKRKKSSLNSQVKKAKPSGTHLVFKKDLLSSTEKGPYKEAVVFENEKFKKLFITIDSTGELPETKFGFALGTLLSSTSVQVVIGGALVNLSQSDHFLVPENQTLEVPNNNSVTEISLSLIK